MRPVLATLIILLTVFGLVLTPVRAASGPGGWDAKAQSTPERFLITPYFGEAQITSRFDHHYPTYSASPNLNNGTFMRYDGAYWSSGAGFNQCSQTAGNCYDGHNGIDFGLDYERVIAAAPGTVIDLGWDVENCHTCGYGMYVVLQHTYKSKTYKTRYAHLSTITVRLNRSLYAGTILGTSGSTGSSSGPHLHFDVRNGDNRAIDPFGWSGNGADPWATYAWGAVSACMWIDGQWVDVCDANTPAHPLPAPPEADTIVIDDLSPYFSKGYGGRWRNACAGVNPACRDWWEANTGWSGHTFRSVSDGGLTEDNWARWQFSMLPSYSDIYEVFIYIPSIPGIPNNTFTWQAPFTIVDGAGSSYTNLVDEWTSGGGYNPRDKWLSLGVYYLTNNSYVYTTDASGENGSAHCPSGPGGKCRMAVDAVKIVRRGAAYVPGLRRDASTTTTIHIQNDGGAPAAVKISCLQASGAYHSGIWPFIPAHGVYSYPTPSPHCKAALIDATQQVSIVAEVIHTNPYAAAAYMGVSQPDSTIYVPVLHKNNWGWYSDIFLQNTSNAPASSVTIKFKPAGSGNIYSYKIPGGIPARGSKTIQLRSIAQLGSQFVGSARITANQPLAMAWSQFVGDSRLMISSSAGGIANAVYTPLIQNYNASPPWTSGVAMQNAGPRRLELLFDYFGSSTGSVCHELEATLGVGFSAMFYPPPGQYGNLGYCSPVLTGIVSGGQSGYPAASHVNQLLEGSEAATSYTGVASPSKIVSIPLLKRALGGWDSGINVMSTASGTTKVTIAYYNPNGILEHIQSITLTGPRKSIAIYPLPYQLGSFFGSALVLADKPVAISVNHIRPGFGGDFIMSHIGAHH